MNQRRRLNTRSIALVKSGDSKRVSLLGYGWSLANITTGKLMRYTGIARTEPHIVTTSEGRIREIDERNPRNTIQ